MYSLGVNAEYTIYNSGYSITEVIYNYKNLVQLLVNIYYWLTLRYLQIAGKQKVLTSGLKMALGELG